MGRGCGFVAQCASMRRKEELALMLERLDGKSYPAYKDLNGQSFEFGTFALTIDRVQGDPFAAPSRLSIEIDHADAGLPEHLISNASRRTGTECFLALSFSQACQEVRTKSGSGKSGLLAIDTPGQEMLERTCLEVGDHKTTVRFMAGLPANGRRIAGRAASKLLTSDLVEIVGRSLMFGSLDSKKLCRFADTSEDADALREQLKERGWVAFVANGSVLPRASGADNTPMEGAIPFQSPGNLERTVELPNAGKVAGMAIPEGITLIVGGGYHGKSTLLQALERGIYNHRPGDGRELVISRSDASKVRAEDGRSIAGVDLSPFINNLPGAQDTVSFSTTNGSGSTSQAAGIMEVLEVGSRFLLLDEDISATNFLIRDERMQALIAGEKEPITPLVQRVRAMRDDCEISTVLVLGGSGDYFEVADLVIAMDHYLPKDLTAEAKAVALVHPLSQAGSSALPFVLPAGRVVEPDSINPFKSAAPYRGNRERGSRNASRPPRKNIKAHATRALNFGSEEIDLSLVSQIVDSSQVRAVGAALDYALEMGFFDGERGLHECLSAVMSEIASGGISVLGGNDLAAFRLQELAASLNRLRTLRIEKLD